MIFLPVAERELRVRARQKATFRARVGAALAACLVIAFFLISSAWRLSPAAMGKGVFWFLSGLTFLWCLLEGPRNTADALSEEKREGTLGLLFLTDLKGYDVVVGKLLATSLTSAYSVLAVVPPLSIPLLLGGVTPGEFWRMVLLLIVTLIFSLTAGLLISANSRNERRAWMGTVTLIGLLAIIPPLFRWVPLPVTMVFGALSPTVGFYSLEDTLFSRNPRPFWYALAGAHGLSWAFFMAACLVLPQSWQDKPVQRANRQVQWQARRRYEAERRETMHVNPVVWMLTRGRGAEWYVWALIFMLGLPFVGFALAWGPTSVLLPAFGIAAIAVNLLLAVWVAAKACFIISDARSSGALDLLLTSPISPQQIVDGHMEALKRQFLPPLIALSAIELLVVALLIGYTQGSSSAMDDLGIALLFTAALAGLAAGHLHSSAWFGLWSGLTAKKSAHAVAKTLLWVTVVPAFLAMCWCFGLIAIMVKDIILIQYARSRLYAQFRTIVTEGIVKKAPVITWRPVEAGGGR